MSLQMGQQLPALAPNESNQRLQAAADRWRQADAAVRAAWAAKAPPAKVAALQAELAAAATAYVDLTSRMYWWTTAAPTAVKPTTKQPLLQTLLDGALPVGDPNSPSSQPEYQEKQEVYERAARERQSLRVEYEAAMDAGDEESARLLATRVVAADDAMTGAMRAILELAQGPGLPEPKLAVWGCLAWASLGFSVALALGFIVSHYWGLDHLALLMLVVGPFIGTSIGAARNQRRRE